jgi:CubicO group peptidase (beta-lactamase class C family)
MIAARCSTAALLLLLSFNAFGDPGKDVDRLLARIATSTSPGCAVAVFHHGRIVYERAVGLADLERNVPLSPRSVFDIGSVSKQFTAMSVVLLAQDGKLSLDDDVRKWIPELRTYAKPITLSHLLHHTSGLLDYTMLLGATGASLEDAIGDDETLAVIARQRSLVFPPGSRWEYSNTNYFLLSLVVRRASGMPLADFARQRIFEPLGMKDTHIHVDHTQLVPHRAIGYDPRSGSFAISMSNWEQSGDGAVHTTVEDLGRWDENFYSGKVGSPSALRLLTTPGKLDDGHPIDYALGLFVTQHQGLTMVQHGGGWAGYRAELLRFPTEHLSVACLCNRGDKDPVALAGQIGDLFLGDRVKPAAGPATPATATPAPPPTASELSALAGTYYDEADAEVRKYAVRGDKLVLDWGDFTLPLVPIGPHEFRIEPNGRIHRFETTSDGAWQLRLINPDPTGDEVFSFVRARPVKATVAAYLGNYFSDEIGAPYKISEKQGQLMLSIRDRPGAPLDAVAEDLFRGAGGLWRFTRDRAGKVTALRLLFRGGGISHARRP